MKNTKKKIRKVTAKQLFDLVAAEEVKRLKLAFVYQWDLLHPTSRARWGFVARIVNRLLAQ